MKVCFVIFGPFWFFVSFLSSRISLSNHLRSGTETVKRPELFVLCGNKRDWSLNCPFMNLCPKCLVSSVKSTKCTDKYSKCECLWKINKRRWEKWKNGELNNDHNEQNTQKTRWRSFGLNIYNSSTDRERENTLRLQTPQRSPFQR